MTSPILFAGQEDISFFPIGQVYQTSHTSFVTGANLSCDTSYTAAFRAGYARYAITIGLWNNTSNGDNTTWIRSAVPFSASTFWTSCRMYQDTSGVGGNSNIIWRWYDAGGQERLRVTTNSGGTTFGIILQTVDNSNSVTNLITSSGDFGNLRPVTPDKIDIFIDYQSSGTFTVYVNGVVCVSYSGNITTNSATALAQFDLGSCFAGNSNNAYTSYSEVIVSTSDTRAMSLVTQAPTASGNADNWTSGSATNMSGVLADYASPDNSNTANQIQQYEVTPAMPSGTFSVISLVQHAPITVGTSGPAHVEFMVRTASTDFTGTSIAPTNAWQCYQQNWDQNPATSAPWATTDLADTSSAFNLGLKSLT